MYTETAIVNVLSRDEMDTLLKGKWEGMKAGLKQGNIETALKYIATPSKEMYRYNFELMSSFLPALAEDMGEIVFVKMIENAAEYDMSAKQDEETISFYIEFIRDEDGIWRIRFY